MKYTGTIHDKDELHKISVLKEIFDKVEEETITEEQIQKILEPIILMIMQGRFRKTFRQRLRSILKPLISIVAIFIWD